MVADAFALRPQPMAAMADYRMRSGSEAMSAAEPLSPSEDFLRQDGLEEDSQSRERFRPLMAQGRTQVGTSFPSKVLF